MSNGKFNSDDIKAKCETKGDVSFRSGKHFVGYVLGKGGEKVSRVTIPKGRKPVPPKTFKDIAGGMLLDVGQMTEFVACSLKKPAYRKIVDGLSDDIN
ncbi:MAG: hypothetical protein RRC34_08585 [Lentisphaeria bacterium]|nr:hypothetical protein [Lentisphaeria bacterium]